MSCTRSSLWTKPRIMYTAGIARARSNLRSPWMINLGDGRKGGLPCTYSPSVVLEIFLDAFDCEVELDILVGIWRSYSQSSSSSSWFNRNITHHEFPNGRHRVGTFYASNIWYY